MTLTPHDTLVRQNEAARLQGLLADAATLAGELEYYGLRYRLREIEYELVKISRDELARSAHGR